MGELGPWGKQLSSHLAAAIGRSRTRVWLVNMGKKLLFNLIKQHWEVTHWLHDCSHKGIDQHWQLENIASHLGDFVFRKPQWKKEKEQVKLILVLYSTLHYLNMSKMSLKYIINLKLTMRYFTHFFCAKSLKSRVCYTYGTFQFGWATSQLPTSDHGQHR